MGGVPLLTTLLNANDLYVKEMAAFALAETCRENRDNQTLAAELGTITAIVELLKDSRSSPEIDRVKAEAVGAIWVLSHDHDANKVSIAAKGGITPTVGALAAGTIKAQQHSAEAISSLGLGNVSNQIQITTEVEGRQQSRLRLWERPSRLLVHPTRRQWRRVVVAAAR